MVHTSFLTDCQLWSCNVDWANALGWMQAYVYALDGDTNTPVILKESKKITLREDAGHSPLHSRHWVMLVSCLICFSLGCGLLKSKNRIFFNSIFPVLVQHLAHSRYSEVEGVNEWPTLLDSNFRGKKTGRYVVLSRKKINKTALVYYNKYNSTMQYHVVIKNNGGSIHKWMDK